MIDSWVLYWDTTSDRPPTIISIGDDSSFSTAPLNGNQSGFVVFDGYIFDKIEFSIDPKAADAAYIAEAYTNFGEDLFDHLRGGYTLAIWDQTRRRLIAGRDVMGLSPFYYWWDGRSFLMSSSIDSILSQPQVSGDFNRVVIAEYIQNVRHSHHRSETFYENIQRLPAAHWLTITKKTLTSQNYWDPLPLGFNWASEDELVSLLPTLERAVARCLSVRADCLALSGGFDSVSIAVLAAEQLNGGYPLHAVSMRFASTACDEGETQIAVARALGMPQTLQSFGDGSSVSSIALSSLANSKTSPSPVLSPWQSMYTQLLRAAAVQGLRKLILGTGGDEMFIVDLVYALDCLADLNFSGLWRFYRAVQRTSPFSPQRVAKVVFWDEAIKLMLIRSVSATLDWAAPWLKSNLRRRILAVKPWISPSDASLRGELLNRRLNTVPTELAPGEGAYVQAIRGLPQSPLLILELEQAESWAKQNGFTLFYPYFDRDLIELALRIHPELLIASGRAKTPLRRLVAERLASVDLPPKKVDFTQTAEDILKEGGQSAWQSLGGPVMLTELGIVEPKQLNSLVDAYFSGRDNNWLLAWLVLSTETWLRARSS